MSSGSISDSFASSMAFSAVPPTPMPSMPGGHQPAPIVGTVFSTQSTIESLGLSITNFDLFSEPPPFAATVTSTSAPGTSSTWNTAGELSFVFLRANSGSSTTDARSLLSGLVVREAHAFVDHVGQAAPGAPAHVHAHLQEHVDDAGVLADRALALGAHARVRQDLRDRVLRGRRLLALIGAPEVLDVIERVVIGNELQRVGDALDEVVLADHGHCRVPRSSPFDFRAPARNQPDNFFFSKSLSCAGLALPPVAFMTWPTKKPNSLSLPER